jgi:hypothetical protein
MPQMGFELTISVFERAKTVYALDHAATVIGISFHNATEFPKTHPGELNVTVIFFFNGCSSPFRAQATYSVP